MPITGLEEMTWDRCWEDLLSSSSCSWGHAKETLSIYLDMKKETSCSSKGRKGHQSLLCPRASWWPFNG